MTQKRKIRQQEQFFMLTPNVRDKLLECKLTAAEWRMWCYLVSLDPFGDNGAKFSPAELMLKCGLKPASYFRAKAKFQRLGLFDFKDGVTKVINLQGRSSRSQKRDSQSQILNLATLKNDSETLKNDSETLKNDSSDPLKPLPDKDSEISQTIQNFQIPQTEGGEENKCIENSQNENLTEISSLITKIKIEKKALVKNSGQEKVSPRVVQNTTKSNMTEDNPIPLEIRVKLEELGIPLDEGVRKAIKNNHISQVWGAIRHIEETWETIENRRGVFLYQVPKQPIEKPLKNPLTPEFLEWYNDAISKGLVQARPAETLPLDQFREPKVFLKDGYLMTWRKVAEGEISPPASDEQIADFFEKVRRKMSYRTEVGSNFEPKENS